MLGRLGQRRLPAVDQLVQSRARDRTPEERGHALDLVDHGVRAHGDGVLPGERGAGLLGRPSALAGALDVGTHPTVVAVERRPAENGQRLPQERSHLHGTGSGPSRQARQRHVHRRHDHPLPPEPESGLDAERQRGQDGEVPIAVGVRREAPHGGVDGIEGRPGQHRQAFGPPQPAAEGEIDGHAAGQHPSPPWRPGATSRIADLVEPDHEPVHGVEPGPGREDPADAVGVVAAGRARRSSLTSARILRSRNATRPVGTVRVKHVAGSLAQAVRARSGVKQYRAGPKATGGSGWAEGVGSPSTHGTTHVAVRVPSGPGGGILAEPKRS